MSATNSRIRRAILDVLWESDISLTKEQIASVIEKERGRWNLNSCPTSNTMGSLLTKSTQIVKGEPVMVFAGDGRNRRMPTFLINRSLIKCEEDLRLTTPYNLLTDAEKEQCIVCPSCARKRLPYADGLCLECSRTTEG